MFSIREVARWKTDKEKEKDKEKKKKKKRKDAYGCDIE